MKLSDVYRENADNCLKLAKSGGQRRSSAIIEWRLVGWRWLMSRTGSTEKSAASGQRRGIPHDNLMRSIAGAVLRDGRGPITKGFEMSHDKGQGIVRDGRGEEQPADKQRAQQSSKNSCGRTPRETRAYRR